MIRYFAAHPNAANILMLAIVAIGLAALPSLNRETFPEIQSDQVRVSVAYPGASPADVEEGICNPLEEATDGISDLEQQRCEAKDNLGVMTLTMREAGHMAAFIDDIKAAVDAVTTFPASVEDPIVEEAGRTDVVMSVAVQSPVTRTELKALAEHYRTKLLAMPEVPIVTVGGFTTHQLVVKVSAEQLQAYQLSIEDIAARIRRQAKDLPVGIIESREAHYQIRFENQRRTVPELGELLIQTREGGGEIRLRDLARIEDRFENAAQRVELNGQPVALLTISKSKSDDSLTVFEAVKQFVDQENLRLPESTRLIITEDNASIVEDRLSLLIKNGWQGLLLAALVLFIFFNARYTFWIVMGLPVSFMGGLAVMAVLGVSINMISMIALLMAIGILMDDAMVISESIEAEYHRQMGHGPVTQMEAVVEAVVKGVSKVLPGVIASFMTSLILFGSLLFLVGETGQIMRVLPIVLLAVLIISLLEAFLILPSHLSHTLQHTQRSAGWRQWVDRRFNQLRRAIGRFADRAIEYRFLIVGSAMAVLIISVSLLPAGLLKFTFFPSLEGNRLEARILMPQGTPPERTERLVDELLVGLDEALETLPEEPKGVLVRHIRVNYSQNADAGVEGGHLATISLDLLNAEDRINTLNELRRRWLAAIDEQSRLMASAISVQFKEPAIGPGGRAIDIRLQGDDYAQLSAFSWALQNGLRQYEGVSNVMDDLRPGKPQLVVKLQPGFLNSGLDAEQLSSQLRAAYEGSKVMDLYRNGESYEVVVRLDEDPEQALAQFYRMPIFNSVGERIPLSAIAQIEMERGYSRIIRIDHQRTVTVTGDVDAQSANTQELMAQLRKTLLPTLLEQYPDVEVSLEGEVKNSQETNRSILNGFLLALFGVYLLLSLQFKNFREPILVLINIPLALIGVIWGHVLMGLDLTMPSLIGFVSLAGVVVNDSILLVEYIKTHRANKPLHTAAGQAVRDRFRAIFLTSVTTVAGLYPMLLETSLQAQVLVPLVCSIVFGMLTSTLLILIVLPSAYSILYEGVHKGVDEGVDKGGEREGGHAQLIS